MNYLDDCFHNNFLYLAQTKNNRPGQILDKKDVIKFEMNKIFCKYLVFKLN